MLYTILTKVCNALKYLNKRFAMLTTFYEWFPMLCNIQRKVLQCFTTFFQKVVCKRCFAMLYILSNKGLQCLTKILWKVCSAWQHLNKGLAMLYNVCKMFEMLYNVSTKSAMFTRFYKRFAVLNFGSCRFAMSNALQDLTKGQQRWTRLYKGLQCFTMFCNTFAQFCIVCNLCKCKSMQKHKRIAK